MLAVGAEVESVVFCLCSVVLCDLYSVFGSGVSLRVFDLRQLDQAESLEVSAVSGARIGRYLYVIVRSLLPYIVLRLESTTVFNPLDQRVQI